MNRDIKTNVISAVSSHIQAQFDKEGSGHDWYHIDRVRKLALQIANREGSVDHYVVELMALMHEMADTKLFVDSIEQGVTEMRALLNRLDVEESIIQQICEDVPRVSFSKGKIPHSFSGLLNRLKNLPFARIFTERIVLQIAERISEATKGPYWPVVDEVVGCGIAARNDRRIVHGP